MANNDAHRTGRAQVTAIPREIESGRPCSSKTLLPLVYTELKRLAQARMNRERPGHTLQATALVHEAYLRLVKTNGGSSWNSRAHFFRAAAEAMRRILVDSARRKRAKKHGGGLHPVPIHALDVADGMDDDLTLAIDEALERLARNNETAAQVVKLRFFVGLTNAEAAEVIGVSERSIQSFWAYARAWLLKEIKKRQ